MKVTSLLFASMLAYTQATDSQRGLATLAQKWNISDPDFTYDALSFDLDFPVSSFVYGDMVGYSLWDDGCKEGNMSLADIDELTAFHNGKMLYPAGAGAQGTGDTMDRKVSVNITIDPLTITQNSNIYSEDTTIGDVTAEIRFCVRFGLYTPTSTRVEVNFLETIVTLTVDLSDGFEIGSIAVEPKDRLVRTANQVYEVRGYQCKNGVGSTANADTLALTADEALERRNQGSVIKVCVTPKDDAIADSIYMRSIDSFSFKRGESITQVAVADRAAAPNQLTSLDCTRGDLICSFETILFAAFYTTLGQVEGVGIASMQFGTQTSRRLRSGGRNAQEEDEVAGAAEFELNFDVLPTADGGTSGAFATGVVAVAVLAISSAAALF